MTTVYRHVQWGGVTLAAMGGAAGLGGALAAVAGEPAVAVIIAGTLLVVAALFGWLTVEVTGEALLVRFGVGLVRRTIPLAEIVDARSVRNRWWYGWGLRLTPHGWLYNVSGLDAVEVRLADGRAVRIGTDEPRALEAALGRAMGRGTAGRAPERSPRTR